MVQTFLDCFYFPQLIYLLNRNPGDPFPSTLFIPIPVIALAGAAVLTKGHSPHESRPKPDPARYLYLFPGPHHPCDRPVPIPGTGDPGFPGFPRPALRVPALAGQRRCGQRGNPALCAPLRHPHGCPLPFLLQFAPRGRAAGRLSDRAGHHGRPERQKRLRGDPGGGYPGLGECLSAKHPGRGHRPAAHRPLQNLEFGAGRRVILEERLALPGSLGGRVPGRQEYQGFGSRDVQPGHGAAPRRRARRPLLAPHLPAQRHPGDGMPGAPGRNPFAALPGDRPAAQAGRGFRLAGARGGGGGVRKFSFLF